MSPEQAKGREADTRSDVWAFGVVLYEMLTGQRPFDGDDMTEVLGAIVRLEPNWERLPADVQTPVRTLLQQCLLKDRRGRVANISTARFVLEHSPQLVTARHLSPAALHTRPKWRRAVPWVVAAATVGLVLGTQALVAPKVPAAAVGRFTVVLDSELAVSPTTRVGGMLAITPDGTELIYAANGQLYLRPLAKVAAHAIPGYPSTAGTPSYPAVAHDGQAIAFWSAADRLVRHIPVVGGTPTAVGQVEGVTGIHWDASGIIVSASDRIVRFSRYRRDSRNARHGGGWRDALCSADAAWRTRSLLQRLRRGQFRFLEGRCARFRDGRSHQREGECRRRRPLHSDRASGLCHRRRCVRRTL